MLKRIPRTQTRERKLKVKKLFLGIDTSNYTTSVALCTFEGEVVLNLKRLLPVAKGERGLRQSDALFAHSKNIPLVADELKVFLNENYPEREIVGVGYSKAPRDWEGSYMPCFLAGAACASSISAVVGCRSYAFSHQSGHIMAALYSAGRCDLVDGKGSFAAFHVSGGTTDILLVTPEENDFRACQIGGSNDINAGQAIDRTGVLMGLSFPCGKEMESLCDQGDYPHTRSKLSVNGLNCNLSGLENLAAALYEKQNDRGLVSAFCFDFIGDTLSALSENLRSEYENIPIIYAGGVMSNRRIKSLLSKRENVFFSEPEFSSDNAAGIALLCRRKYIFEN